MKKEILLISLLAFTFLFYRGGHYWGFDQDEAYEGSMDAKVDEALYEYEVREEYREEAFDDVLRHADTYERYVSYEDLCDLLKECMDGVYFEELRDNYLDFLPMYTAQDIVETAIDLVPGR